jgi:hypothetical protein
MKYDVSLPCLRKPATEYYPGSEYLLHILMPINFIFILISFHAFSSIQISPLQFFAISHLPHACYMSIHRIFLDFIALMFLVYHGLITHPEDSYKVS